MMRAYWWIEGCQTSTPGGGCKKASWLLPPDLPASASMKWLKILYVQVIIGIVLGVLLGLLWPPTNSLVLFGHSYNATDLQPLAEVFIKAIKMLIAPIIFRYSSAVAAVSQPQLRPITSWMISMRGFALCSETTLAK